MTDSTVTKLWHGLTCPAVSRWRRRLHGTPFWRDDKVAQMFGSAHRGCSRCGRGALGTSRAATQEPTP